jgi:iron complex transport system ATP-binding protein
MLRAADVSFTYRRATGRSKTSAMVPVTITAPDPAGRGYHQQALDHVLRDIFLEVDRGDLVGILGPNGSGKTTLLKLLGGVFTPASGSVTLDGRSLADWSRREIARRVAFVPQETTTPFDFTVLDIVLMGRFPHLGVFALEGPEDLAIARSALEATGTAAFEGRAFSTLSGGEKQRVVVASALAQSPALLLLDEPTASLDIGHQIEVQTLLRRLNADSGVTMVLSTHDLNLAAALCRRLVLLKDGHVLATGRTEEVLTPDAVRELYHVDAEVLWHPRAGHLTVVPIGRS